MNDLQQFLNLWLPATQRGTFRCYAWWAGGYGVRNVSTFQSVSTVDEDTQKIKGLVDRCGEVFVYMSTFSQRSTKTEYAESVPLLWLDLDNLGERLDPEPSMIWTTSQGHYQAVWQLDWEPTLEERTALNKGLFEHFKGVGADASWDVSRRLRLPGTINRKPGRGNWLITIAEVTGLVYAPNELPQPIFQEPTPEMPSGVVRGDIRLLNQLPVEVQELWASTPVVGERSDILMHLLLELAKLPITDEEMFELASTSGSNKFVDRPEQLWREVQKARRLVERPPAGLRITLPGSPVTQAGPGGPGALPPDPLAGWLVRADLPEDFEVKWLVNPFLPQKSILLAAGLPGTRKSWIVSHLAVSTMHGVPFMNHPNQVCGSVAYVAPDDERERLSERIHLIERNLGVSPGDSEFYWRQTGFSFLDPKWSIKLEEFIKATRPKLIIMDGLYLLGYNAQDYGASLPPRLVPLKEFCSTYELSFVIVHHASKQGVGADPRLAGQGLALLGAFFTVAWAFDDAGVDARSWQRVNWRIAGKAVPGRPTFKLSFGPDLRRYEYVISEGLWPKKSDEDAPSEGQTAF